MFIVFFEDVVFVLRKVFYFGDFKKDIKCVLYYYKQVIEFCQEYKFDYFFDEVMGIKFKFVDWFEKIDNYCNVIYIFENLFFDCQCWIVVFEKVEKEEILLG